MLLDRGTIPIIRSGAIPSAQPNRANAAIVTTAAQSHPCRLKDFRRVGTRYPHLAQLPVSCGARRSLSILAINKPGSQGYRVYQSSGYGRSEETKSALQSTMRSSLDVF